MMRFTACLSLFAFLAPAAARADVYVPTFVEGGIRHYLDNGTQVAPIQSQLLFGASGIARGPDGMFYVSAQGTVLGAPADGIYRVDPLNGAVSPFIILQGTYVPGGVQFGPDGNMYVTRNGGQAAPPGSGRVDRFNPTTGSFIDSPVIDLTQPTNLLFRGNDLFISNFGAGTIMRYNGTTTSQFASGGGLAGPAGLLFASDGSLLAADLLAGAVRRFNGTTGVSEGDLIAAGGALANQFPKELAIDNQGRLTIANLGLSFNPNDPPNVHGNVMLFDATTGAFISTFASDILGASGLLITPLPEPGSLVLLGGAAFGYWLKRRRS